MKEIFKKLQKIEIQIRKAVTTHLQGDFHSIFKGSGLEFNDLRAYQYGDDFRNIDWNVSAKGHGAFVKTFKEEKEQTVFFMLDVSGSQQLGPAGKQKLDLAKEIYGVLALSAISEGSQAGCMCFSDQKEKYIKPGKGLKHAYRMVTEVFGLVSASNQTDLNKAIHYALNLMRRKSIMILISDFIDDGYLPALRALGQRHDLVVIHVSNAFEMQFPSVGIVPLYDKERGTTIWLNTSSGKFNKGIGAYFQQKREDLSDFCRKNKINYLSVQTGTDYIESLTRLFKFRNRK